MSGYFFNFSFLCSCATPDPAVCFRGAFAPVSHSLGGGLDPCQKDPSTPPGRPPLSLFPLPAFPTAPPCTLHPASIPRTEPPCRVVLHPDPLLRCQATLMTTFFSTFFCLCGCWFAFVLLRSTHCSFSSPLFPPVHTSLSIREKTKTNKMKEHLT